MTLTYRQLQATLKQMKADGYDVRCKLNAKTDVLQAEYERLQDRGQDSGQDSDDTVDVATEVSNVPSQPVASVTPETVHKAVDAECDGSSCELPDGYYRARFKATVPSTTIRGSQANRSDSVRKQFNHYLSLGFCSEIAMHCAKYEVKPSAAMKACPELATLQMKHSKAVRKREQKQKQAKRVIPMKLVNSAINWFNPAYHNAA